MYDPNQKKLQEAAVNVINRKFTFDDMMYFARNMNHTRYPYMTSDPQFKEGYDQGKETFIDILNNCKFDTYDMTNKVKEKVNNSFNSMMGNDRYSTVMDDPYYKGLAYAFQEISTFLGDEEPQPYRDTVRRPMFQANTEDE